MIRPDWMYAWRFDAIPQVAEQIEHLDRSSDRALKHWVQNESPAGNEFQVAGVRKFDMESDESEGRKFLFSLGVALGEKCYVTWAGVEGIRMPVGTCFEYFYDVWYPGSDDLWVVPESRSWLLECDHDGLARFVALTE